MVELLYILVHLTHTKYIAVVCVLHVHEGRSACMHMFTNSTMEVYRLALLHIHTHIHAYLQHCPGTETRPDHISNGLRRRMRWYQHHQQ